LLAQLGAVPRLALQRRVRNEPSGATQGPLRR